jgi:hypothetical protein
MSSSRIRTLLLTGALLSSLLAASRAATADKPLDVPASPVSKAKFQISLSEVSPPEYPVELQKLQRTQELFKRGLVPNSEVAHQESVVESLRLHNKAVITVGSDGGTLAELLEAAAQTSQRQGGFSLTLINAGDPSDLNAKLPPFMLQRVHWGTVIEVLSKLLSPQGLELSYSGGDSSNPAEAKSVVCVLRRIGAPSLGANESNQPAVEAIGLSDYIASDQSVDSIVDAIRTAWSLDPGRAGNTSSFQLKYHPPTKILLISGSTRAIAIARQVVANLAKKPASR